MKRSLPAILGLILLGAVILQGVGKSIVPDRTFHEELKAMLPAPDEIPGWTTEYKPIADTPEMQRAVGEILNYDDAIFAVYTKNSVRISIYLAYWTPGKMPHRSIANHTPDVCWVLNGWEKVESATVADLRTRSGARLLPAEVRQFQSESALEHVAYWHVVDGVAQSYATGWRPPWYAPLTDLWERGLKQRQEQFFVRVSSNVPLSEFMRLDPVQTVLGALVAVDGPAHSS